MFVTFMPKVTSGTACIVLAVAAAEAVEAKVEVEAAATNSGLAASWASFWSTYGPRFTCACSSSSK